jgi:AbrB family looped-hinge helix DNA binding protein
MSDIQTMGLPIRETSKVGKRGVVVIPAAMRRRFGIEEGATVIAEEREDGVLIRLAVTLPIEHYTDERIAEFLLNNSMPGEDYEKARAKVREMGLDPDTIPHEKPDKV